VLRDGFTRFSLGEEDMDAFDDVAFPIAIGRAAQVMPGFSTAIVTTASGHEQRNTAWANGRLQGRDADGLDCVGLIAVAFGRHDVPRDYDLRTADEARWMAELDARLTRMSGPLQPGQVLLMQAGPAQLHLGLWTGHSLIHAHAGLRQIVETPGPPAWPILGQWQSAQEDPWRH
jgi:hypothetical protein